MIVHLPCYCAGLRQATRAISLKYDAALRTVGLTLTQYTLLTVLSRLPQARVNDLAEALAMDQTTLSRTLKLMERDGLLSQADGEDRRETRWQLSTAGRKRMRSAQPRWRAAQRDIERLLGASSARRLSQAGFRLAKGLST